MDASVIVHRGGVHGGRYFTFIRPDLLSDQWYKFNDEQVTEVDIKMALEEELYGGEIEVPEKPSESEEDLNMSLEGEPYDGETEVPEKPSETEEDLNMSLEGEPYDGETELPETSSKSDKTFIPYSSAYALVYIHDSFKEELFCDIDANLKAKVEKELEAKTDKNKKKAEAEPPTTHVVVHFQPLNSSEGTSGFYFERLEHCTFNEVVGKVAQKLGTDSSKIRLTGHNYHSQTPKPTPIIHEKVERLSEILDHDNKKRHVLYYEKLETPLDKLQDMKTLEVFFHHDNTTENVAKPFIIQLPKKQKVDDVLNELKTNHLKTSFPSLEKEVKLRLLEIENHCIHNEFLPDEIIEKISNSNQFCKLVAEEIPREEINLGSDFLLRVHRFYEDSDYSLKVNFGRPFYLRIGNDEIFREIKPRLCQKLKMSDKNLFEGGMSDKNFDELMFHLVSSYDEDSKLGDYGIIHASGKENGKWERGLGINYTNCTGFKRPKRECLSPIPLRPLKIT